MRNNMCDFLEDYVVEGFDIDPKLYDKRKLKEHFTTYDLVHHGLLVVEEHDNSPWKSFAVLEFQEGLDDDVKMSMIFYGEGPSGNLRECRHTYWGQDENEGYVSYPDGRIITDAFKYLSKYYDEMV